ncbi:unnamed protein product [Haemonchus placei]|uniref:Uncharacterized protein n=1 Tax=Haemonchus placei TaxID=6290 RepID=A0A3P7V4C6_HAEPC|nr:unnamed protein product [Haemonchus placei]
MTNWSIVDGSCDNKYCCYGTGYSRTDSSLPEIHWAFQHHEWPQYNCYQNNYVAEIDWKSYSGQQI